MHQAEAHKISDSNSTSVFDCETLFDKSDDPWFQYCCGGSIWSGSIDQSEEC